jgi:hypothetical protein
MFFSMQRLIISLNSITQMIFVIVMRGVFLEMIFVIVKCGVFLEVGTEYLNIN